VGAICDPTDFSGVVEVASGILGPIHGAVTVDLAAPGCEPLLHPWKSIAKRVIFDEVLPNVVITVGSV
jgi:hypothetical protein